MTNLREGDIIYCGEHRIIVGDATDANIWDALVQGEQSDLVLTDPPYGLSYADKNKFLNKYNKGALNQTEIANDHSDITDIAKDVWGPAFKRMKENAKDGCVLYCFGPSDDNQTEMRLQMRKFAGVRQEIIWVKNKHVLGRSDYNYKHESILYTWKPGAAHYWCGEHHHTSILYYDKPHASKLHPTMKPVSLLAKLIHNSSVKGDLVVDPFLGSGSTLIAAERLGRRCYGIELDPHYCEIAAVRWEALTHRQAIFPNDERPDVKTGYVKGDMVRDLGTMASTEDFL